MQYIVENVWSCILEETMPGTMNNVKLDATDTVKDLGMCFNVGLERLYVGCENMMIVEVDLCRTDDALVATYSCVVLHQAI